MKHQLSFPEVYAQSIKTNSMELQTQKCLELLFSPKSVLKFEMLLFMATFTVLCFDDANINFLLLIKKQMFKRR